jgi:hypothetical protein
MLDTGSEISLLSEKLVKQLGIVIKKHEGPLPYAANGKPLPILGKTYADIEINDGKRIVKFKAKFRVCDHLPRKLDVLIGQDILSKAKVNINCAKRTIRIGDHTHVDVITSSESSSESLKSSNETQDTESIETPYSSEEEESYATSEPLFTPETSSTDIKTISDTDQVCVTQKKATLRLDINSGTPEEIVNKLNQLANKYRDVFAVEAEELGRTNLFVHVINTADHAHISQTPYQQSEQKRNITYIVTL